MNLEEFYRQARSFKTFTPSITADRAAIVSNVSVSCEYAVIGKIVVMFIDALFTVDLRPSNVFVQTPTLIRANSPGFYKPIFTGTVDNPLTAGCGSGYSNSKLAAIARADSQLWAGSGTNLTIGGLIIYRNGE